MAVELVMVEHINKSFAGVSALIDVRFDLLPGDWEGDAIESAGKNACIAAFADRKTKLLLAKIMPDKTAATLNKAAVRASRPIPAPIRNTLPFKLPQVYTVPELCLYCREAVLR
jgi:IS30 family transposase